MAPGRRCSSMNWSSLTDYVACGGGGEECLSFEFARVRSFGRKRIVISQNLECCWDSEMSPRTPLKRLCSEPMALDAVLAELDEQQPEEKSVLEEARFEKDPEIVTRLPINGREAVESALEKLAEKQRQQIEKERGGGDGDGGFGRF